MGGREGNGDTAKSLPSPPRRRIALRPRPTLARLDREGRPEERAGEAGPRSF